MRRGDPWERRCPQRSLWAQCGAYHREIPPGNRPCGRNVRDPVHRRTRAENPVAALEQENEFDRQSIHTMGSQASSFGGGMIAVLQVAQGHLPIFGCATRRRARAATCSGWMVVK